MYLFEVLERSDPDRSNGRECIRSECNVQTKIKISYSCCHRAIVKKEAIKKLQVKSGLVRNAFFYLFICKLRVVHFPYTFLIHNTLSYEYNANWVVLTLLMLMRRSRRSAGVCIHSEIATNVLVHFTVIKLIDSVISRVNKDSFKEMDPAEKSPHKPTTQLGS